MVIDLRRVRRSWFPVALVLLAGFLVLNYKAVLRLFYPLQYKNYVFKYAQKYQVDPYLVEAIMRTESKFRATAESASGARGIMQIMPETGAWIAGQIGLAGFHPDLLYDPETNIMLGCWYLADLQRQFAGDLVLVVAAYNGGRGNVQEWLREKQWTGEHATLEQIPFQETREYVRKVMTTYSIYRKIYPVPK